MLDQIQIVVLLLQLDLYDNIYTTFHTSPNVVINFKSLGTHSMISLEEWSSKLRVRGGRKERKIIHSVGCWVLVFHEIPHQRGVHNRTQRSNIKFQACDRTWNTGKFNHKERYTTAKTKILHTHRLKARSNAEKPTARKSEIMERPLPSLQPTQRVSPPPSQSSRERRCCGTRGRLIIRVLKRSTCGAREVKHGC